MCQIHTNVVLIKLCCILHYHLLSFILCSYGQGTETVRAIFFNRSKIGEPHLDCADFKKMSNLCLLNLGDSSFGNYCQLKVSLPNYLCYLSWQEYPLKSMPSIFFPENLVELRMHSSKVEQLWNKDQVYAYFAYYIKFSVIISSV